MLRSTVRTDSRHVLSVNDLPSHNLFPVLVYWRLNVRIFVHFFFFMIILGELNKGGRNKLGDLKVFFFSVGHVGNFIFFLYLWDLLQFMAIIALESSRKSHGAFCESWMLSQGLAQMGINSGSRNPDEQFRYVGEISCTAKGFTEGCACK